MLSSNKKPQKQNDFHLKCRRKCQLEVGFLEWTTSGRRGDGSPGHSNQWQLAEATPLPGGNLFPRARGNEAHVRSERDGKR